ncbi:unnamed protein product [Mytilus coruscus]|uniref:Uncharacterized protein n=1 Tax=Mytilus coruscus TaxID=42192 RepID=A0A6J8AGW7_MYTCO|nr:unnamed protein product [Mytilus coruscus]
MNQHIRTMHCLSEIENDTNGDDESQATVSSEDMDTDNDSEVNNSETDNTLSGDSGDEFDEARAKGWNNSDSEEDSIDPWDVILSQTFDTKDIPAKYLNRILWNDRMEMNPIHQKIGNTVKQIRQDEEYDEDEAWKYADRKRKFLFDDLLKTYSPLEIDEK